MKYLQKPFFVPLLAIFPVLAIYARNQQHFLLEVVALPMAVSMLAILFGLLLFFGLFRDIRKAALMVGVCCILLIIYNPLYGWLEPLRVETPILVLGPVKVIAAAAFVIIVSTFVILKRASSPIPNLIIIMNVVAVTMIIGPATSVAMLEFRDTAQVGSDDSDSQLRLPFFSARSEDAFLPSIYHIVLDGYGRNDVYENYFDFDNALLNQFLEQRGFILSGVSRSNYTQTALSFASMLNGGYLQDLLGGLEHAGAEDDRAPLFQLIRKNAVFTALAKSGYRIQTFDSGYAGTDFSGTLATVFSPNYAGAVGLGFLSEFQSELLNLTPIPLILRHITGDDRASNFAIRREKIEFAFDNVGQPRALGPAGEPLLSPTYTLVHILGPHGPHLYRAGGAHFDPPEYNATGDSCAIINEGGVSKGVYIDRHVNYVQYLNRRLMQAIDTIHENHDRQAIILVTSDHGPGSSCEVRDLLKPAYMRERTAILLAAYLPGRQNSDIELPRTNVNLYRYLFNEYFGAELPLLPDRVLFSTSERPFDFFDVTDTTDPFDRRESGEADLVK
jgi:hypothetical protein